MNNLTAMFACVAAAGLAACVSNPAIPDALRPGPDQTLAMVMPAKGVQIYECRAAQGAALRNEWVFVAPDAELLDARGNTIGHHGAGPVWQANDGSRVAGTVKARADAPAAGAVPWLLLDARNAGPAGSLSKVTSIQRVNTAGGVAPSTPCTQETIGRQVRVHYVADYRFFTANR